MDDSKNGKTTGKPLNLATADSAMFAMSRDMKTTGDASLAGGQGIQGDATPALASAFRPLIARPAESAVARQATLRLVVSRDGASIAAGTEDDARVMASALSVDDLGAAERFVLWALRRWLGGRALWEPVWREFRAVFDQATATRAMAGLERVAGGLRSRARRAFVVHRPCCRHVGLDEVALLGIVAACQRFDAESAALKATWLVSADAVPDLVAALNALAQPLLTAELVLPDRSR